MISDDFEARLRRAVREAVESIEVPPDLDVWLVLRPRRRHRPGRRVFLGAVAAVLVAATITTSAVLISGGPGTPRPVVLRLADYSLRLPARYTKVPASSSPCKVSATVALPSVPGPVPSEPSYAGIVEAAGTSGGGCIAIGLGPPYTPTPETPDPEALVNQPQPVEVGSYHGIIGTGPDGTSTVLFVEISLAGGRQQDLTVASLGLSRSQLVTVVTNGLSAEGTAPTGDTSPGRSR